VVASGQKVSATGSINLRLDDHVHFVTPSVMPNTTAQRLTLAEVISKADHPLTPVLCGDCADCLGRA
jgi:hypothetical protein